MTLSCSSSLPPYLEVYRIDPGSVVQQHPDLSGSSDSTDSLGNRRSTVPACPKPAARCRGVQPCRQDHPLPSDLTESQHLRVLHFKVLVPPDQQGAGESMAVLDKHPWASAAASASTPCLTSAAQCRGCRSCLSRKIGFPPSCSATHTACFLSGQDLTCSRYCAAPALP